MQSDLLLAMAILWAFSFVAALIEPSAKLARLGVVLGCAAGMAASLLSLHGVARAFPLGFRVGDAGISFELDPGGSWLLFFGLIPAFFAAGLSTPAIPGWRARRWFAGLSLTLLGALGVFGLQDSMSFLIAWEVMSVGGAAMILGEGISETSGGPMLFMLALLG